ncbi:MAG: recombinase family protein [Lachnospiraceae bacterium]|nr:recombinase family protein [Lachnospiraceae bacterium]
MKKESNVVITEIPKIEKGKPRVCAYVRVSTDKDEQEDSFAVQSEYWTKRFSTDETVEYVGLFTDEGISGKKMKNRKGLLALLDKARSGGIDRIYTKSISRFARNYTEIIAVIRELREKGIPIIFEKENINTLDPKCNLMLSVMSSLAEEELRSMSKNQKWAARKRFASGSVELSRIYGYDYADGKLTVNPETAKIVKRIFELFLNGLGSEKIAKALECEGYATMRGGEHWSRATILRILKNEKYIGDSLLQKNYMDEHGKTKNRGELPQYYVENTHEPIISREDFEAVKRILDERYRKYRLGVGHCNSYLMSGK